MPNTTVFRCGLNMATSAADTGPLIAITHWVPLYIESIDPLCHDINLPVTPLSALINPSADTVPPGEIIWNINGNGYALSDNNDTFITSGAATTSSPPNPSNVTATISNPIQSVKSQINTLNGVPLTNAYHGINAAFTPGPNYWTVSGCTISAGNNAPTLPATSKYFQVIDYFPVSADTQTQIRGQVKCRLAKDIGYVKFNAIALYVEPMGYTSATEPTLFSITQLKTPVVKTGLNNNSGFSDITIDVQLGLQSISANYSDIFYSTSGDYWSRVPDGIYYPEKVGVGSFIDTILSPQASIHARRTRAMVSLGLTDAPVFRADFDDTHSTQIDINDDGITHQTFSADTSTFGLEYDPSSLAIYPDDSSPTVRFGSSTNRFSQMFLKQGGIDIQDDYSGGYAQTYFNAGAGGHINYTDNMRMSFNPLIVTDAQVSAIAYIDGADIRRTDEPINFYTLKGSTDPELNIISDIDPNAATNGNNIWGTVSSPLPTGQYGVTHKNILWQIANAPAPHWTNADAIIRMFGRGEIDLNGPVGLDALTLKTSTNTYDFGMLFSRRTNVLIAAGVLPATNLAAFLGTVDTGLTSLVGGASNASQWASILAQVTTAPEFVMLGGLYHAGSISPVTDANYNLGSGGIQNNVGPTHARDQIRYKKLFVQSIGGYNSEIIDANTSYEDNRVETIYAKDIGLGIANVQRINRAAILGMLDTTTMDIGAISNDSVLGDANYPYAAINGLWPKRYAQLGINTDFANVGATPSSPQFADGQPGGRSFWLSYINNMYATHELGFWQAFTIRGAFRGQNGLTVTDSLTGSPITDVQLYNGGDTTALDWPGIHKVNTAIKLTLGDNRPYNDGYIDSIYSTWITATNMSVINATIQNLTVPNLSVGNEIAFDCYNCNANNTSSSLCTVTYKMFNDLAIINIPSNLIYPNIIPSYYNLSAPGTCSTNMVTIPTQPYPSGTLPIPNFTITLNDSYIAKIGEFITLSTDATFFSILNSTDWTTSRLAYGQITNVYVDGGQQKLTVTILAIIGTPYDSAGFYVNPAFPFITAVYNPIPYADIINAITPANSGWQIINQTASVGFNEVIKTSIPSTFTPIGIGNNSTSAGISPQTIIVRARSFI